MEIHDLPACTCLLMMAALVVLVLSSFPTDGQGLGDAITVRPDRDSLRLEPGEEGWVDLNVSDTADVPLWVQLHFTFVAAPHHSIGTIMPEVFQLAPGESRNVRVEVVSHASLWQDPDHSDFKVHVVWGLNASLDQGENWEGDWQQEFDVVDDFSHQEDVLISVIVIMALIVGCIMLLGRRHRRFLYKPM
jgi:hypothetical protein